MVSKIQALVTYNYEQSELDSDVWDPIQVLDVFYKANLKREENSISYKEFYNDAINQNVKLDEQYEDYLSQKK
jgi:hypothetical protein